MTISFEGQVAIVTGAGNGLGRPHALELGRRGAKVVVNDFGGARDGTGGTLGPAELVAQEIIDAGGEAIANGANVTNYADCEAMVADALAKWGRVDVLINNAGILRDKSFGKMEMSAWNSVVDVHLNGSVNCTKAVWNQMKEQNYGRILMTTSTSGIYGNFGQANYGAAKLGLIGLMNTLCIEGAKNNIQINCLAPTAATRMTEDILTQDMLEKLDPKYVTPAAVLWFQKTRQITLSCLPGLALIQPCKLAKVQGFHLSEEDRTVLPSYRTLNEKVQVRIFYATIWAVYSAHRSKASERE